MLGDLKGKTTKDDCPLFFNPVIIEPLIVPNLLPFMRSFVARYSACAFVGEKLSNDQDLIHAFENSVSDIGKEFRPGVFRVIFPTLNEIYMR